MFNKNNKLTQLCQQIDHADYQNLRLSVMSVAKNPYEAVNELKLAGKDADELDILPTEHLIRQRFEGFFTAFRMT